MKLYNTLTRQIDDIKPLSAQEVSIYTCGPTVYDYPHIGNWFTFVRYDLLVRVLRASGLTPKWVMNITDVGHLVSDADEGEDKLEKGAKREGKTAWDIANFYTDYFVRALEQLNFTQPDYLPRATEHIREQIDLVKRLEEKGFTYSIDDGVYYDTSKFEHYADFAKLDLDDQHAGARVAVNLQKRNQSDFALWKFSPKDHQRDMEWASPWGKGFPGWHLECSAMAFKYLGETLDIHSGGIDHIPVHHTNEIAQSEAASGKPLAHYWMHANHVLVEGEKIAKSLGNGITLEQVEAKGYDLETLRLYILESHYRTQSQFSWEGLAAAKSRLTSYQNMAALVWQPNKTSNVNAQMINQVQADIKIALENDLNTPAALERLSFLDDRVNASGIAPDAVSAMQAFLQWVDEALGLKLSHVADISDEQKQILSAREAARKDQDWAEADKLRDKLTEQGIGVRDTAWGQVWIRL